MYERSCKLLAGFSTYKFYAKIICKPVGFRNGDTDRVRKDNISCVNPFVFGLNLLYVFYFAVCFVIMNFLQVKKTYRAIQFK